MVEIELGRDVIIIDNILKQQLNYIKIQVFQELLQLRSKRWRVDIFICIRFLYLGQDINTLKFLI